ncbi:gastrin [Octodon degus]|uniref:Gastrin n=1 Tax=Octodon degus TaxID=10160 RepID=A0A6P3EXH1_OCTDE|nr:gastrin [Octodon degus]
MPRLCVCTLAVMLVLATLSEASWRPRSQPQDTPWDPMAGKDLPGPASAHRSQLGPRGPAQLRADLSNKRGPWTEEEEVYGWMDFGRRSAEDPDQRP